MSKEILSAVRLSWLISALLSPGLVYAQNDSGIDPAESESAQTDTQDASLSFEMRQRRLLHQMRQQDPALDASWDTRTGRLSRLSGVLSEPMPGSGQQVALDFFVANRSLLNMTDPYDELTVIKAKVDHRGWENVKLQQSYEGLLVEGSQLVLSIDDQRQVRMVNSRHYIGGIDMNTKPAISSGIATSIVRAHIAVQKEGPNGPIATKVVYPYAGNILLAWKVQLLATEPLGDFTYYVDAQTGAIINHYDNMIFARSQVVFDAANGTTFPPLNSQIVINNTPSEGTGYGTADAVEKKIYDNTTATYNFFFASPYNRDSWDGAGAVINSISHWDANLNNAIFWTSGGVAYIRYGDGSGLPNYAPYGNSLDIVAHEFTHGVTATESNLIYQGASGALNESISDIFGILAGQRNDMDWLLAEDVFVPADLTLGMRSFSHPPDGTQPDHMDDFAIPDAGGSVYDQRCWNPPKNDNDCVHINSGIPNKAAYLMGFGGNHRGVDVNPLDGAIAASRVMMGRIFYLANTTYLVNSSDFASAKIATEDAVQALFPGDAAKLATVTNAWLAVGVPVPVSGSAGSDFVPDNNDYAANLPQNIPFGVDILAILALLGCASYKLIRFPHTNTLPTKSPKA